MVIVHKMPHLSDRTFKFIVPEDLKHNMDDAGGWIVNSWIPGQPDSKELMTLLILLNYNLRFFICALLGEKRFYQELGTKPEQLQ